MKTVGWLGTRSGGEVVEEEGEEKNEKQGDRRVWELMINV